MRLSFTYQVNGGLASVDFVPTIPFDRLQEMMQERGRRTAAKLKEARGLRKERDADGWSPK
ncbi:hypothetical protein [Mesorhizobium sp. M1E.F.Ca.ET.063.01.1.1]|uniref:hypothetical protein n=1 Tax=Mesorhizobium sp. M1E.F.Ca.ET.063.01.1.1 TaxID=2496750 RepID=UPI0016730BAE|nr:hypothetical protein [Mesorhizobium sp. M1E.F.Ca.ET.063.01.1.1]